MEPLFFHRKYKELIINRFLQLSWQGGHPLGTINPRSNGKVGYLVENLFNIPHGPSRKADKFGYEYKSSYSSGNWITLFSKRAYKDTEIIDKSQYFNVITSTSESRWLNKIALKEHIEGKLPSLCYITGPLFTNGAGQEEFWLEALDIYYDMSFEKFAYLIDVGIIKVSIIENKYVLFQIKPEDEIQLYLHNDTIRGRLAPPDITLYPDKKDNTRTITTTCRDEKTRKIKNFTYDKSGTWSLVSQQSESYFDWVDPEDEKLLEYEKELRATFPDDNINNDFDAKFDLFERKFGKFR